MRRSEKAQEIENMSFFINDQKIMFGYTPHMEKLEKYQ